MLTTQLLYNMSDVQFYENKSSTPFRQVDTNSFLVRIMIKMGLGNSPESANIIMIIFFICALITAGIIFSRYILPSQEPLTVPNESNQLDRAPHY